MAERPALGCGLSVVTEARSIALQRPQRSGVPLLYPIADIGRLEWFVREDTAGGPTINTFSPSCDGEKR
jgi:hypothetical protein